MQAFRRLPPLSMRRPCALTIGNFDGVHRGHQAILARLREAAAARGLVGCVLTFEPHPREFFAARGAGAAPARISTQRDKLEALARHGVDRVDIAHFNQRLSTLSAESFIDDLLVDGLQARWILIGDDFRFGAGRRGDFAMLTEHGARRGFEVVRMNTVIDDDGGRISSSAVRRALADSDMARVEHLLGRPYSISGHVIHGRKLGRTLGFPTLNLRIPAGRPALAGVFAARVHGLAQAPMDAVASLGTRPAVEADGRWLLEVHVFGLDRQVYGATVRTELLHKLRDEAHYPSLALLRAQIDRDATLARDWLAARPCGSSACNAKFQHPRTPPAARLPRTT
jgi:riboflavin kinase/FMN adenylyltransferase